ncbi:MAG: hypothetical protein FWG71_06110 [Synergistaceae bacterium]|nr:hypothetical protein [Synergistaceae bacterium]
MRNVLVKFFVLLLCVWGFGAEAEGADQNPYEYEIGDVSKWDGPHIPVGPQWFAVTYTDDDDDDTQWPATYGGALPENDIVPWSSERSMNTSADLLPNFSSIYLNDGHGGAIQSIGLIIKEGNGVLDLFCSNIAGHSMDVLANVPGYNVTNTTVPVQPSGNAWRLSFKANSPRSYGSRLGYLTFRQSDGSGYRQSINIPLIVANVSDSTAALRGSELYLDMTIFDDKNNPVTRKKFRWGVGADATRDLGTLVVIDRDQQAKYNLTAQITNRSGVRYLWQRYDIQPPIMPPSHWEYDLTPDLYGTLPRQIWFDPQSQIAPGLVTTYANISMDMTYGTRDLIQLYPFPQQASGALHSLRLTYRVVGGMSLYDSVDDPSWTVSAFRVENNFESPGNATEKEIAQHAKGGSSVVMPADDYPFEGVEYRYFGAEAFDSNSFIISADATGVANNPGEVALLPMRVRMRISRLDIAGRWNNVINAENGGNLAAALPNICTIWLYSQNTNELYANLFDALKNRGKKVEDCIQAFTYTENGQDYLYVDFMVLLADAESRNSGKTAFVQVVEHDTVQYIYIGDGNVDGEWTLGFFVTAETSGGGGGGGGDKTGGGSGCGVGWGIGMALLCLPLFLRTRKTPNYDDR